MFEYLRCMNYYGKQLKIPLRDRIEYSWIGIKKSKDDRFFNKLEELVFNNTKKSPDGKFRIPSDLIPIHACNFLSVMSAYNHYIHKYVYYDELLYYENKKLLNNLIFTTPKRS